MEDHFAAPDRSAEVDRSAAADHFAAAADRSAAVDHFAVADRRAVEDRYEVVARSVAADRSAVVARFAQVDRFAVADRFAAVVRMSAARPSAQALPPLAQLVSTPDRVVVLILRFFRVSLAATLCQWGQTLLALPPEHQQENDLLWMERGSTACSAQLRVTRVQLASEFPSQVLCRRVVWGHQPEHVRRLLRLRPERHAFLEMGARPHRWPECPRWRHPPDSKVGASVHGHPNLWSV